MFPEPLAMLYHSIVSLHSARRSQLMALICHLEGEYNLEDVWHLTQINFHSENMTITSSILIRIHIFHIIYKIENLLVSWRLHCGHVVRGCGSETPLLCLHNVLSSVIFELLKGIFLCIIEQCGIRRKSQSGNNIIIISCTLQYRDTDITETASQNSSRELNAGRGWNMLMMSDILVYFFCVFVFVHFLNVFPDKRTENEIYLCCDGRVRGNHTEQKENDNTIKRHTDSREANEHCFWMDGSGSRTTGNEGNTTKIRKEKTKFKQSKWQNEIRNMENERKCTFSIWKLLTL